MGITKTSPVLVVGASGRVGSELVRLLESKGTLLRAASRNPSSQQARTPTTRWVELDLDKPETFDAALEGVETAFLMARPGDERPQVSAIPLLHAMVQAGVRRVINLTAMGTELRPDFGLRQVELSLENSGMKWTHLRPNFFMQIFCSGPHFAQLFRLRQLRLPAADARISFIDSRDIAAVAAKCILEQDDENRAYTLTGPTALSHADVTKAISSASESEFTYVPLSDDEARHEFAAAGLPAENVERLIGFYRIVRTGMASTISPHVKMCLGRAPREFSRFAEEHAKTWHLLGANPSGAKGLGPCS